jgi:hypothetical protein
MGVQRLEFFCRGPRDVVTAVIEAVLTVLRPSVTSAWVDAFADGGWRDEQQLDVAALLAVEQRLLSQGKRRTATGMGIDLDVRSDDEHGLLTRLAAYSIHAEAWVQDEQVFAASDTGDHAWFALTPTETASAASRLEEAGYAFADVLTRHS